MILPLHEQVRARVRAVLAQLHGITDRRSRHPHRIPAEPHARRPRHAGRVRFGAPPAQSAPRDCPGAGGGAGTDSGSVARRSGAQRVSQRVPRPSRVSAVAARSRRRVAGASGAHREDHRRAHRDQPQQGRAHRASPEFGARRHARARAHVSAATPSKCRTTSTTPACRSPTSWSAFASSRSCPLDDARRIAQTTRFDYYCWDLYARVTEWYAGDKDRLKVRAATLHDLEHGIEPTASLAAFIADTVVRAHLKTMARLNIDYQLLTWEGDILRLKFWARAFEVLKQTGAVYLQTEGRHAGCWVMKIDDPEDTEPRLTDDDGGSGGARESHRAIERHRRLRRQGHGVPVLEIRTARPGFPLSPVRHAHERRHAVGHHERSPRWPSPITRRLARRRRPTT